MAKGKRVDEPTGTETVGHEWDGIEELNTPLPRWWLWSFYATIIWGVAYTVFFPAWPMLSRATAGVLGWSSRSQLERELSDIERERAPILRAISSTPTENIGRDPKLSREGAPRSGSIAFSATGPVQPGARATPISTTTIGFGAATSSRSNIPSTTASGIPSTPRPACRRCRHSVATASSSRTKFPT
jgi:hypothetical protein